MAENPREDLAESACLELLRGHHFGRVAFIEQADEPPAIMPVNYLMHGETVVFRTDPNSNLAEQSGRRSVSGSGSITRSPDQES